MRARERDLIDAIDRVLEIPFPGGRGIQSASVRGLTAYVQDMRIAVPLARQAIILLRQGGSHREVLRELNRALNEIKNRTEETKNAGTIAVDQRIG